MRVKKSILIATVLNLMAMLLWGVDYEGENLLCIVLVSISYCF
jgi:hypothetical protein